ncbi:hypothetical protein [Aliiroseovarius crassostreae]|uniref:hypothetical protein n=1 Tax=Aliiroseovarius crassostreae TaxID=154981 RepID=UPI00220CF5AC|nr:hypothetical protein [Aliiroseovarius crassostreae]UWP99155.1 hypothetical protein K3X53_03075 [Aliiroseovarius crassostreae]
MGDILRTKVRDAFHQIKTAEHMFEQGLKILSSALETMEACEEILLENSIDNLPLSDQPVTEHRRKHRMGPAPKIDSAPEARETLIREIRPSNRRQDHRRTYRHLQPLPVSNL